MKNNENVNPPLQNTDFDKNNIPKMTTEDAYRFRSSKAYKKYVAPIIKSDKKNKHESHKEWWWSHGILILNTIFTLIAAITGILSLIMK